MGLIVFQVDVLEVQYAALLASLQRSSDFEAIGFAHDCYLNNMVKDCFLLSKVHILRGWYGTLKRVVWYFEEGGMVL